MPRRERGPLDVVAVEHVRRDDDAFAGLDSAPTQVELQVRVGQYEFFKRRGHATDVEGAFGSRIGICEQVTGRSGRTL
jgi:hypothetical protein